MTGTETKLPPTMKAIVLHGPGQATVDSVPTPHPGPGSITIQVLHAMVHNAAKALIEGTAGAGGHPTLNEAAVPKHPRRLRRGLSCCLWAGHDGPGAPPPRASIPV
ncbi:hypothetical protein MANI_117827 [Metarhizium anisopliae]